ncbi:ExeA family protein [Castellaniella caeni]|uniref:ExeA family protein n=1 Tax=Castellaniella caeni TaxID=266123 RepID=UPI000C9FF3B0|nr:AAA family ATPase [Castellaniella caeni]
MSLKLKAVLRDHGIEQIDLANAVAYSQATISQLLCHAIWPRSAKQRGLHDAIRAFLKGRGITDQEIATAFEKLAPTPLGVRADTNTVHEDVEPMSIPKQILHPNTRRHFKLVRDPFDEVTDAAEFYQNEHIRFTRAAMLDAARRGGFLAVVGESGSGKTTLRRDLQERIEREQLPIQVIRPYVIGMEANDVKGATLKAAHIAEAIMTAVAPHASLRASHEARFRQVETALRESYHTGMRSVLLIEEAHALPLATLRHLKRFIELEDGFKRLLSVILLGQPELAVKLNPRNASVREVVQRCELITLPPLGHYLEEYVAHRLHQVEVDIKTVITADGLQAVRERLEPQVPRGHEQRSYLYPLAVHNLMIAAMNLAAENGAPCVSADIVMEVSWAR